VVGPEPGRGRPERCAGRDPCRGMTAGMAPPRGWGARWLGGSGRRAIGRQVVGAVAARVAPGRLRGAAEATASRSRSRLFGCVGSPAGALPSWTGKRCRCVMGAERGRCGPGAARGDGGPRVVRGWTAGRPGGVGLGAGGRGGRLQGGAGGDPDQVLTPGPRDGCRAFVAARPGTYARWPVRAKGALEQAMAKVGDASRRSSPLGNSRRL